MTDIRTLIQRACDERRDDLVTTRAGDRVRIYATDGKGEHPVHGAFWNTEGWHSDDWRMDGCIYDESVEDLFDLIPAPPRTRKITGSHWVNYYQDGGLIIAYAYSSVATADRGAGKERIACVEVPYSFDVPVEDDPS